MPLYCVNTVQIVAHQTSETCFSDFSQLKGSKSSKFTSIFIPKKVYISINKQVNKFFIFLVNYLLNYSP